MLDACYRRSDFGAIVRMRRPEEVPLDSRLFRTLKGMDRARLYTGMSDLFLIAHELGLFYHHLHFAAISLVDNDLDRPRITTAWNEFYEESFKTQHTINVKEGKAPAEVNFATFYSKFFFHQTLLK